MPYDESDCIDALQRAEEELGRPPKYEEYEDMDIYPSLNTIKRICGSFNEAVAMAGMEPRGRWDPTYTEEDCVEALLKAYDKLGHSPAYHEYREMSIIPAQSTIERVCGSWNEAKELAGLATVGQHETVTEINSEYFKEIDTPEKAYWLGFLFGDGSIIDGGYRYMLSLELQQSDGDHIREFATACESKYKVVDKERHVPVTVTRITHQEFVDTLRNWMSADKSHIPDLDNYRMAFIRGLFDADGTSTPEPPAWRIASTRRGHLVTVQNWLADEGVETNIYDCTPGTEEDKPYSILVSQRIGQIWRIYDLLWPEGPQTHPSLMRKEENLRGIL